MDLKYNLRLGQHTHTHTPSKLNQIMGSDKILLWSSSVFLISYGQISTECNGICNGLSCTELPLPENSLIKSTKSFGLSSSCEFKCLGMLDQIKKAP